MLEKPTVVEMFDELVRLGVVVPAHIDPASWMEPTAYISVPTALEFVTPPVQDQILNEGKHAKLGARIKRNQKGKKRPRR